MLKATLIVSQAGQPTQEVESGERETLIGSALNNTVCLEPAPGVAHYHAVIERRGDDFWLSDCGTQYGTKLNGESVLVESKLEDGDLITLGGGDCRIEFYKYDSATRPPGASLSSGSSALGSELSNTASSATGSAIYAVSAGLSTGGRRDAPARTFEESNFAPATDASGGGAPSSTKIIVGSVVGAALVTGAAALFLSPFGGGCNPSARIMTPLSGSTLRTASTIRVEVGEKQCVKRISFQLDGEEVASADAEPYEAALDSRRLTRFTPGSHVLSATVETTDGEQIRQPGEVYIALEAAEGRRGSAPPSPSPALAEETPAAGAAVPLSAADVQEMAERLAIQISGKSGFVVEREMTARILTRTAEFAATDLAARAAPYRTDILRAFGTNRGVRPLLGLVLAMSRSKFDRSSAEGGGIWRTPAEIARAYLPAGEKLDTPQREAQVAAFYLKELYDTIEWDNYDLAVACYGCTLTEADQIRQRLSAVPASERRNFWRMVERKVITEEQAERVVRFYAAGIVGENPRRFGATHDRTLSLLEN